MSSSRRLATFDMSKLETEFRTELMEEISDLFPGAFFLFNNAQMIQGVPDLLVLWGDRWAALETKRAFRSSRRPNQPYYVEKLDKMSFAAFVSPENKGDVLDALQHAWQTTRRARFSKR